MAFQRPKFAWIYKNSVPIEKRSQYMGNTQVDKIIIIIIIIDGQDGGTA